MWGCLSHREHKDVCAAEGKLLFLILCCTWEAVSWWFHGCDSLDRAGRPIGELAHSEKEGTDGAIGMSLDLFNFESQFNTTPRKILKHTKSSSTVFVRSLKLRSAGSLDALCCHRGRDSCCRGPFRAGLFCPRNLFQFLDFLATSLKRLNDVFLWGWNGGGCSMCVGDALSDIRTPPSWDLPVSCTVCGCCGLPLHIDSPLWLWLQTCTIKALHMNPLNDASFELNF